MIVVHRIVILCLMVIAVSCSAVFAGVYYHPGAVFGQTLQYVVKEGESLVEIARYHDLGFNEIVAANPHVDPFIPPAWSYVTIPLSRILPDLPSPDGIVINIPEMRLYWYSGRAPEAVLSFPVGIGDWGKESPLGNYTVIDKITNPSWHVPRSILLEKPELAKVIPPGPDNPMGSHALRLSRRSILIHGTNRPFSIGRKASHGCIRLYPEDITRLFQAVRKGTQVTIINQPIKVAEVDGRVYIEVHEEASLDLLDQAINILQSKGLLENVDGALLGKAIREKRGGPVRISLDSSGH